MTLSSKLSTLAPIRTIANLSTRKRTFMILLNPGETHKADWFVHIHVYGVSFVYFSLTTGENEAEYTRVPDTLETMQIKADMINGSMANTVKEIRTMHDTLIYFESTSGLFIVHFDEGKETWPLGVTRRTVRYNSRIASEMIDMSTDVSQWHALDNFRVVTA